MIRVGYAAGGQLISDFELEAFKDLVIQKTRENIPELYNMTWTFGNSTPIHAILLLIAQGKVSHEEVDFVFNGRSFRANKYGSLPDWPKGFCDTEYKINIEKLRCQLEQRKHEKTCGASETCKCSKLA